MREIKFRGLRSDGKGWFYGYFVKTPANECRIYVQPFLDATSITWYHVIPESVGQFTGLHDKNGKEIYDGDIVLHGISKSNSEVGFKDGSFILNSERARPCIRHHDIKECEVIGNIHQG